MHVPGEQYDYVPVATFGICLDEQKLFRPSSDKYPSLLGPTSSPTHVGNLKC